MSPPAKVTPRTFYLNEQHELARSEKEGGGRIPTYTDINWATKGRTITRSLQRARTQIQQSADPTKDNHFYLLAAPVEKLTKESKNKRKAVEGKVLEETDFAEKHSRVFRKLGVDLISVFEDGSAVVHMKPETLDRLSNTVQSLAELGPRERSRWATINEFGTVPPEFRIDSDWLGTLPRRSVTDAVIEFQPLLTRSEIDSLVRAVVSLLTKNLQESIKAAGSDFSGRQWIRGNITPETLTKISQSFFSIQSLHSPLISIAAASRSSRSSPQRTASIEINTSNLPVIGILDTGVPADHAILTKYRRGTYIAPTSTATPGDEHGCFVASRAVFGDPDYDDGLPTTTPTGTARYYDINISGSRAGEIEDKGVYPALQAIVATAPDVRVFNISFDSMLPLDQMSAVKASEALRLVQDLDNFVFQNDILIVIAAGNSPQGLVPATPYPRHFNDEEWALGAWARSFNSLTCGSYVARIHPGGIVTRTGWPSPFCRVGPGLNESFKPDFSASGGNCNARYEYRFASGLGVWGLNHSAMWEDLCGTSFAAPLLARETAFALQRLQGVCQRGAQPFGATVKAFLALTATAPIQDAPVKELAERTLGRGMASAERLDKPVSSSGVLIWQGVLQDEKDIARVQIPVPAEWWENAEEPVLRLAVSWDPPVNSAVKNLWSTRDVTVRLRTHPEANAHRPSNIRTRGSYPMIERIYYLRNLPSNVEIEGDTWLLELSYAQTAEYHPAMNFPPQQRVAFAAELFDEGSSNLSPQATLQALPITQTMTHLTIPPTVSRLPVVLKTPI